jgi:hypothetical protein
MTLNTTKEIIRAIRNTKGLEVSVIAEMWGSIKITKSEAIKIIQAADSDAEIYAHFFDDGDYDGYPEIFLNRHC